jgi:hypothetical protein
MAVAAWPHTSRPRGAPGDERRREGCCTRQAGRGSGPSGAVLSPRTGATARRSRRPCWRASVTSRRLSPCGEAIAAMGGRLRAGGMGRRCGTCRPAKEGGGRCGVGARPLGGRTRARWRWDGGIPPQVCCRRRRAAVHRPVTRIKTCWEPRGWSGGGVGRGRVSTRPEPSAVWAAENAHGRRIGPMPRVQRRETRSALPSQGSTTADGSPRILGRLVPIYMRNWLGWLHGVSVFP